MGRNSILTALSDSREFLPRKQRILCDYILSNPLLVGTLTVSELAAQANVAATTVLRLSEKMGYSSFNQFKHDLFGDSFRSQYGTYSPFLNTFSSQSSNGALSYVCDSVIENCKKIVEKKNQEQFEKAVTSLLNAQHVFVLGLRSAASISMYFENSIRLFMNNSVLLSLQQEYLFDRILDMTSDDVLFLISTWPCTKKTLDFATLCSKRKIPIILVTNSEMNPIVQLSTYCINSEALEKSSDHIFSLIICQAFIEELGRRVFPKSNQKLHELDEFFKENNVIVWDQQN